MKRSGDELGIERVTVDTLLVEHIYEAAALPDRWPAVLRSIADRIDAMLGCFVWKDPANVAFVPSLGAERIVEDYIAEGWAADPEYAAPLWRDLYPGFQAEPELRSMREIETLPVHTDFLTPRGLVAGVGTILQGTSDAGLQLAFEGIPSHYKAIAAARWLDDLRAPLGRALSLSALIRDDRAEVTVEALERSGAAAAVVSGDGRLRAANPRFAARMGNYVLDDRRGLRFTDRLLQARFAEALAAVDHAIVPRSLAVAGLEGQPHCVMHLLPLRRQARDVFGWDGVLILLAEAANASIPGADLLRLLFDLTPAEAKLTRRLLEGWSPVDAATALGISEHTARTHLRRVFAKTGVTRQSELTRLLLGLGMPH